MNKNEQLRAKELLQQAALQIDGLRRRVAELEPKARAYDTIERLAELTQRNYGSMAEIDVKWAIESFFEEMRNPTPDTVPA